MRLITRDLACRCGDSLAVIAALFAALVAAAVLAEQGCVAAGGRVSDAAWACDMPGGHGSSLWSHATWSDAGIAILVVGLPVYLGVAASIRRLLARTDPPARP